MSRVDRSSSNPLITPWLEKPSSEVAKAMQEGYPETWRRFDTKAIEAPNTYWPYKCVVTALVGAVEETRHVIKNKLPGTSNIGIVAGLLEKYDFPTYYVSSSILEALKNSHPPKDRTWKDVKLPYPALFFMLPKGSVVESPLSGHDLVGVGVAQMPGCDVVNIPTIGRIRAWSIKMDRTAVYYILAPNGIEMNDVTFPSEQSLEPSVDWINANTSDAVHSAPGWFCSWVCGLAANLVLVMQAKRELVEPGTRTSKNKRTGREVWSPTWLGRSYDIRSGPRGEAAAHFSKLGWRAGHFKIVRHGTRHEQTKTSWIEPYVAHTRGLVLGVSSR